MSRAFRALRALDLSDACEIPQLAAIVEPGRLARALGDALAETDPGGPALLRCAVTKVHYRPGKDCRLVISARFRSGRGGEEQLYFGRLRAAASREREERRATAAAPRFGPPSLHLAQWDLRLWAYPNDPELPGLALLADPERVRERFASSPDVFDFERAPRSLNARRASVSVGWGSVSSSP